MYQRDQRIHFVGIGGIGMSGIAEVLINLGHKVSGSDLRESDTTRRLAGLGAKISLGHHPDQVEGADVVVVSSAVNEANPEVIGARERLIPVIPRAEMLSELMRLKYGIAVAGAHGKTTCTSLVATLLAAGGLDPTVVVGGKLAALGSNARLGSGEFLVAEADESDGSFTRLTPVVVVVTNVDREHMEHYGSDEVLDDAFVEFMNKVPFYGAAVLCLDDNRLAGLIPRVNKRTVTYGLSSQADVQARDLRPSGLGCKFTLYVRGRSLGEVSLPLPGRHNVQNALAALGVARELGVDLSAAIPALGEFEGVGRRFEAKGTTPAGALVVDDYGHHPSEIKATLSAARECWPDKRLVVVFQPHRYSRSRDLFDEFTTAFYGADELLVLDIYAAGESEDLSVSAEAMAEAIRAHGHRSVEFVGGAENAASRLAKLLGPGDVLLTMGAGDVWRLGEEMVEGHDG
ncbi:MAG: UDP-N-acetylmuramate--L-alanine ligase [Desulfarculaceae bacterium]|nr:UDP-N-acetylmuramate--L-alanine ligase [Desulfarculaceae bacterium]MCF8070908.1 UDP-N-acetylmuramate--L-alanine ligase [Desulfarculaceae bacterium]MCF8100496.1 UDP-N-acetylmuramate--L-alanine ligase [Desulfarculaceae bacterium]MCF8116522.1 UDP-N-acetylmuramate--L-alanine ligase [Desulfarculaceae bacterium]